MEAIRDFIACDDAGPGTDPARPSGVDGVGLVPGGEGLAVALAALQAVSARAVEDAASWDLLAASDFAGQVEEISRTAEYLQLVAAGGVDRARKQAAATAGASSVTGAVTSWTTGWRESPAGWDTGGSGAAEPPAAPPAAAAGTATGTAAGMVSAAGESSGAVSGEVRAGADDGYRTTAEFLRARLLIGAAEARRRLSLAEGLLPRHGLAGQLVPPAHPELGAAVAAGEVASRAASIVAVALERVRPLCDADAAARLEHALTRTAAENDADFLVRVAHSWADAMDQDGAEPSEELLRQLQGAFIRRRRHGLHHLEIFASTDQFEHLLTVMNTGANPRTGSNTAAPPAGPGAGGGWGVGTAAGDGSPHGPSAPVSACAASAAGVSAAAPGDLPAPDGDPGARGLDRRTRAQQLLDGLVGACKGALAAGGVPASGGLRPQVMVTIDYRDLLTRLGASAEGTPAAGEDPATRPPMVERAPGQTGALLFTGPVTAATVRKIACDADIIPVLLGGQGRVLDIGRASRIFPPHIRKALTARDRGCAFPGCTIPAPWCEAHHITYWSRGGPTGTENGTLLCSHHHHLIHKEQWTIRMQSGIPWFIPPPHIDPRQQPRRNHYFRPAELMTAV